MCVCGVCVCVCLFLLPNWAALSSDVKSHGDKIGLKPDGLMAGHTVGPMPSYNFYAAKKEAIPFLKKRHKFRRAEG